MNARTSGMVVALPFRISHKVRKLRIEITIFVGGFIGRSEAERWLRSLAYGVEAVQKLYEDDAEVSMEPATIGAENEADFLHSEFSPHDLIDIFLARVLDVVERSVDGVFVPA